MFKNELKQIGTLARAVENLCDSSENLNDARCDMDTCVNFLNDEDMIDAGGADDVFRDLVKNERLLASNLNQFDVLLNRVIAERLKLSDFTFTR
jgi:hypothetical protein